MKKILSLLFLTLLVACSGATNEDPLGGSNGKDGVNGEAGVAGDAGSPGEAGPEGARGPAGINGGDNGIDNRIKTTWSCNSNQTAILTYPGGLIPELSMKVAVWYHSADTTAGDNFARGGVDTATTSAIGTVYGSAQSSEFWSAVSPLASQGYVAFTLDVAPGPTSPAYWEFRLNRAAQNVSVSYVDGDIISGKVIFTSPCTIGQ